MALPSGDQTWWDLIQQWKPGVLGMIGTGIVVGIRMWWKDKTGGETKEEKVASREERQWLSRQDLRVRETVDRTNVENDKLRARCEAEEANAELWEGRARRADEIAHDLRFALIQAYQAAGVQTSVPRIPLLEEPLK